MADDQSDKTTTIDQLVNELTKKGPVSTLPPRPSSPFSDTIQPKPTPPSQPTQTRNPFPSPRPATPIQPKPQDLSKPQFSPPIKTETTFPSSRAPQSPQSAVPPPRPMTPPSAPLTTPSVPVRQAPPQVKEYQSSIRTMTEDVSSLKKGQKPTGLEIPRKVEPGKPTMPEVTPKPAPAPATRFPSAPSVELGKTEKSKSMNLPGLPSREEAIKPERPSLKPQEVRLGEESTGGIAIPKPRMAVNPILISGIAVLVLLAGFAYWFFMIRTPSPVATVSPTPIQTPTPTPIIRLSAIFPESEMGSESVMIPTKDPVIGFRTNLATVTVSGGKFKIVKPLKEGETNVDLTPLGLTSFYGLPQQLKDSLGNEATMLVYGQVESFNSKGQVGAYNPPKPRLVVVAEINNTASTVQAMLAWEPNASTALKDLFGLGKASANTFLDNLYRGVAVRYNNYPNPDNSIDYSVIGAFNGKVYLIITNSRESAFATMDKLLGF